MTAWKVDKGVGNVRNDTAQLLEQAGPLEVSYKLRWDGEPVMPAPSPMRNGVNVTPRCSSPPVE